jgi:hypothetical protein
MDSLRAYIAGVWEISMRQTTQANKEGKKKKIHIKSNAE